MNLADVVIIGGGPAGSSVAREAVHAGLDTVVIDRATFPRDKVCAGWITPAVVAALELDLGDYARTRVLQPIHALDIGLEGAGRVAARRDPRPVSHGILRREFDDYLLRRSGARLELGRPPRGLRRDGGDWIVDERWRSPVVIGAGGHFCPAARRLGARPGRGEPAVLAQEIEFRPDPAELSAAVDPEVPRLTFCGDLSGYGWVVRKGPWLNVGLGRLAAPHITDDVARFRRRAIDAGIIPASTPERFHGHAYLLATTTTRRLAGEGILLVGDAAGLAYPESGEGIRPAVESGILAARAIAERGPRAGDLHDRYRRAVERRFGRSPTRRRTWPAGLLPAPWRATLARSLLRTEWFVRHVVQDRWFLRR